MKIVDIIEYEGDNTTFVWRHPGEDFNTLSQLIVRESQEALLFKNGEALDLFGPGRHTLRTQNIPLLNKIVNIPTGGESPFKCEVYFINKTEQMAIKWGVGEVNFLDPTHNDYVFKIGASGELSLRVSDSRKLIVKLVGTERTFNQETLQRYFKTPITTHIKTILPALLREKGLSIFEVESHLPEFSEEFRKRISDEMSDYGISLEKLWINTITKPENDPFYITINRQRGERITLVNQGEIDMQRANYDRQVGLIGHAGEVEKQRMDIDTQRYKQDQLGYTYQQDRGFDVMEKIAANEGSGSDLRNAAMGIGMGFGVGGAFGEAISNISNSTMLSSLTDPVAPAPKSHNPSTQMPSMIGLQTESRANDNTSDSLSQFKNKVDKLVLMRDSGLLTEQEFEIQRQQLLEELKGN